MKTIKVTTSVTKEIEFPYAVPCVFKYSENSDNPLEFEGEEFGSTMLIKVDEEYKVSDIRITKIGLNDTFMPTEYNLSTRSCYNLLDIVEKYKMIQVPNEWWEAAKTIVFCHWASK